MNINVLLTAMRLGQEYTPSLLADCTGLKIQEVRRGLLSCCRGGWSTARRSRVSGNLSTRPNNYNWM